MKFLEQTIALLDQKERDDFIKELKKQQNSRKDVELFILLGKNPHAKASEIVGKLYRPANMNAYHSLRKRLMLLLTGYISMRGIRDSVYREDYAPGLLAVARFMLERREYNMAGFYLRKAEKASLQDENHDILESIYNLQIAYAEQLENNLDLVLKKWKANQEKYLLRQKLDIAYAVIREQLSEARRHGDILDPDQVINTVFREFDISVHEANNPSFMFRIVSLTRSAIVSSKGYYVLESMVLRIYNRLKKAGAFGKKDEQFELGFVYMIAHVLYRNRKFADASIWVNRMNEILPPVQFRASFYYAKYIQLSAAIAGFSGENKSAIDLIHKTLKSPNRNISNEEKLNMQLNLAVYFFQATEYKKADDILRNIGHTDGFLEGKMGKEWRFKKNMIELIVLYELHEEETALQRLKAIERNFEKFLEHPAYIRAKLFMGFIRRVILQPQEIPSAQFANEVIAARMGWDENKEDIQAITFFCWLKSKMLQRPYYEVLIETMNNRTN